MSLNRNELTSDELDAFIDRHFPEKRSDVLLVLTGLNKAGCLNSSNDQQKIIDAIKQHSALPRMADVIGQLHAMGPPCDNNPIILERMLTNTSNIPSGEAASIFTYRVEALETLINAKLLTESTIKAYWQFLELDDGTYFIRGAVRNILENDPDFFTDSERKYISFLRENAHQQPALIPILHHLHQAGLLSNLYEKNIELLSNIPPAYIHKIKDALELLKSEQWNHWYANNSPEKKQQLFESIIEHASYAKFYAGVVALLGVAGLLEGDQGAENLNILVRMMEEAGVENLQSIVDKLSSKFGYADMLAESEAPLWLRLVDALYNMGKALNELRDYSVSREVTQNIFRLMLINSKCLVDTWKGALALHLCGLMDNQEKNFQLLLKQTDRTQNIIKALCYLNRLNLVNAHTKQNHFDYLIENKHSLEISEALDKVDASPSLRQEADACFTIIKSNPIAAREIMSEFANLEELNPSDFLTAEEKAEIRQLIIGNPSAVGTGLYCLRTFMMKVSQPFFTGPERADMLRMIIKSPEIELVDIFHFLKRGDILNTDNLNKLKTLADSGRVVREIESTLPLDQEKFNAIIKKVTQEKMTEVVVATQHLQSGKESARLPADVAASIVGLFNPGKKFEKLSKKVHDQLSRKDAGKPGDDQQKTVSPNASKVQKK